MGSIRPLFRQIDLLQQTLTHNNKGGGCHSDTATFPSQLSNSNLEVKVRKKGSKLKTKYLTSH